MSFSAYRIAIAAIVALSLIAGRAAPAATDAKPATADGNTLLLIDADALPLKDASRFDHRLVGEKIHLADGRFGKALDFRKEGALRVTVDKDAYPTDEVALSCWVNLEGSLDGKIQRIACVGSSFGLYAQRPRGGQVPVNWYVRTDKDKWNGVDGAMETGQWVHLKGVYDGDRIALFVNGELADSKPVSGAIVPKDRRLRIGIDRTPDSRVNGRVDDLLLRNATSVQVAQVVAEKKAEKAREGREPFTVDFSEEGWRITNPNTPGKVTYPKGHLRIQDDPGGKATWGSMAFKQFEKLDITALPYLVLDIAEIGDGLGVSLSGRDPRHPKKNLLRIGAPGLHVINLVKTSGWKGPNDYTVYLYTYPDASAVEITSMKFTDKLNEEEKAALKRGPVINRTGVPEKYNGLTTLGSREGAKPAACDPADGERTVYTDPVTGREVWRMTDHPAHERHIYYDILAWNANGDTMMWTSMRPGGTRWLMDADGTNIRPLPDPADGGRNRGGYWSHKDPYRVFYAQVGKEQTEIKSMDVRDGSVKTVVTVPLGARLDGRPGAGLEPPHPDDRFFLLRWGGQDNKSSLLVVVDSQTGKTWKLDPGRTTHRVRFTKHPDHSVFINSNKDPKTGERKRTQWRIKLDGSMIELPNSVGHPDWSPDGKWLGGFTGGGIWLIPNTGEKGHMLIKTNAGGHGGFAITTGRHHVGDTPNSGPYRNLVYVTELATGELTPIAYHGSSYSGWASGHPDPESTHPAPICSPDETKICYDSDLMGNSDFYVAVWKRPGAPRDVRFSRGVLSWTPPELHAETAGYNVYRKDGEHWRLEKTMVTDLKVAGLPDGRYAVSSREWSGLESKYAPAGSPETLILDSLAPKAPGRPSVAESGPQYVKITWPAVDEPDLAHYNVYACSSPDEQPSRASLVGSPRTTRFVDWGMPPKDTFTYRVTAVDRHGNESAPSLDVSASPTPPKPVKKVDITFEAEDGEIVKPFEVGRDGAGTTYVYVPENFTDEPYAEGARLTFAFEIPEDATYDLYARALGPDGGSNSFYAAVDDMPLSSWGIRLSRDVVEQTFQWIPMTGFQDMPLKKGKHTLTIASREDGAMLDKILLTNDPEFDLEDLR